MARVQEFWHTLLANFQSAPQFDLDDIDDGAKHGSGDLLDRSRKIERIDGVGHERREDDCDEVDWVPQKCHELVPSKYQQESIKVEGNARN